MSCQLCGRELLGPECLCVQNAMLRNEHDQALRDLDEARSDRDRFESECFHWKTAAEQTERERIEMLALTDEATAALNNARLWQQKAEDERDKAHLALAIANDHVSHQDTEVETLIRERDKALALLTEGLAIWNSEPRPSLRSSWYDFWQKVAKEKP